MSSDPSKLPLCSVSSYHVVFRRAGMERDELALGVKMLPRLAVDGHASQGLPLGMPQPKTHRGPLISRRCLHLRLDSPLQYCRGDLAGHGPELGGSLLEADLAALAKPRPCVPKRSKRSPVGMPGPPSFSVTSMCRRKLSNTRRSRAGDRSRPERCTSTAGADRWRR